MVAEAVLARNRSGGVGNRAERVGLPAAASATHGQHGETFARRDARHDLAGLLETDVDLHRETRHAETAFVPREDTAHGGRDALRPLLGAQPRSPQAVETPFVQSLVREAPGERLTRLQLPAAHAADLGSHT